MRADLWTDERIAALKSWWSEGSSGAAIARRLGGVSRSAVLGKIFRLRLAAAVASVKAVSATANKPAPDVSPSAAPPPRPRGKSLLELTNKCCRWPHGRPGTASFFFCGESGADLEGGMPYCPRHAQRAYRGGESLAETAATAAIRHGAPPWRRRRPGSRGGQPSAIPPHGKNQKVHGRSIAR
jgi:GcrA cell cycle regulator